MPLSQGQIINNRYRIVKLLGQGGMGAVYRAWDIRLNGQCAVKENLDLSPQSSRQFSREATLLANLSFPNLPRVTDHFMTPGQGQYLIMDFVEGQDLQDKLNKAGGPLSEHEILPWILQVCDALNYLHSRKPPIIHRDIKPGNIKITPQGQAILVDFGIAKEYDPRMKTTTGARALTPGYSPQEQYGQGITDKRSDIYALGATLYALLTGHEPVESVQRNMGIQLTPPHVYNPAISALTETAIQKAMEMLPADRYQSVAELKSALQLSTFTKGVTTQVQSPIAARRQGRWQAFIAKARSWVFRAAVGFLALVALTSLVIAGVNALSRIQGEQRATQTARALPLIIFSDTPIPAFSLSPSPFNTSNPSTSTFTPSTPTTIPSSTPSLTSTPTLSEVLTNTIPASSMPSPSITSKPNPTATVKPTTKVRPTSAPPATAKPPPTSPPPPATKQPTPIPTKVIRPPTPTVP